MFKTETEMKTVAALAVICLLVVDVRDRQETPEEGVYVMMVASKCSVEIGLRILPPSPSCGKQEIIATLKDGAGKECLNTESNFVQELIKKMMESRLVYVCLS
ncbi:hypothetical protein MHYP_G00257150 [Metynnis hypsauchen]